MTNTYRVEVMSPQANPEDPLETVSPTSKTTMNDKSGAETTPAGNGNGGAEVTKPPPRELYDIVENFPGNYELDKIEVVKIPEAVKKRISMLANYDVIRFPFMEAVLLYASFCACLYQFFQQYGEAEKQMFTKGQKPVLPKFLIFLSSCVSGAVFLFGWDNIAKKHLYYKLLPRGIILDYDNKDWYKSPVIGLIALMAIFCLIVLFYGASIEVVFPMMINVVTVGLHYKKLLETEKWLIPLNILTETDNAPKEAAAWLSKAGVVKEEVFRNYLKTTAHTHRCATADELHDKMAADLRPLCVPNHKSVELKKPNIFEQIAFYLPYYSYLKSLSALAVCCVTLAMGSCVWFYGFYKMSVALNTFTAASANATVTP